MQRFPSHRMPFPQWQPGMDPNGGMNQSRAAVQFPGSTQGPRPRQQTFGLRQRLLPYPKQSDTQGLHTMHNGNGTQKIRIQNNIISYHNQKKKIGSDKWTKIGGMVDNDGGLQEVSSQDAQAYGQQMEAQQQQSSQMNQQQNSLRPQKHTLKIQQPNRLKTDSNPRMVPDQPQKISSSSNPAMQNNNNGHCMQNYSSGPSMQITKSHPTLQINNSAPFMHDNSGQFVQNNSGSFVQNKNCGSSVQWKNRSQFMQNSGSSTKNKLNNINQPLIQINSVQFLQNHIVPSFKNNNSQFLQNRNDGQSMQNNNSNPFKQNNKIHFIRSFNCMQSNRNQLETGQNKPDSDIEILTSTPFESRENMQSKDKSSPFKHTFGSNSGWQSSTYTENSSKNKHKKPKSQALKQHQKIQMLQKELSGKNIEMKRFSKEVEDLKEKTAEVMKGNKHLVEVIKKKDMELESNKTLMIDMKAEIKRAQKEVLNCLQKTVAKSQEALQMDLVKTNEKTNIEVQIKTTDFAVGKCQMDVADDHSSSILCLKIQHFLEFNGLAQKISSSIEKVLDIENKSVLSNLKLGRQDVESAISAFKNNVLLLFDEVTCVIQKKIEVENCLADIEKKIEQKQVKLEKTTTNIEDLLRKVNNLSKKDLKTSAEAQALRGELESLKTELEQLRKDHRKLEIDNKRVVNKLNGITSNLDLDIEIL